MVRLTEMLKKAGKSAKRVPALPGVLTVFEFDVSRFDAVSWIGALVPARTPKNIITKINTDMVAVLSMPDVKEKAGSQRR